VSRLVTLSRVAVAVAVSLAIGFAAARGDEAARRAWFRWFDDAHARAARAQAGAPVIVADVNTSYAVAQPSDSLYECVTRHCIVVRDLEECHDDLDCYCAPRAWSLAEVEERLAANARCTVDKREPARSDDSGACRHGRCAFHVDPPR
jgi:hypothetical protein